MRKIKTGDDVLVMAGKDRGKRGTVLRVLEHDKIVVEGVNIVKRHTKSNPNTGSKGGILEKEMPVHVSNVSIFNPSTSKGDKIGFKRLEDGRKVRIFKSNQEVVDV